MSLASLKARATRLLPNNTFARGVSVLVGGTAGAQLLMVLASPLLTRLYTPNDFGLLAVYGGFLATLAVIASLRYQLAIPLPENDRDAAGVAVASLLVVLVTTALCTIVVWIWGGPITHMLNTPELEPYLGLLPLGLLLTGTYQVFNLWAVRTKAFPTIARTKLTQSLASVTVQTVGYALGPVALLLGQVANQAAGNTTLIRQTLVHHGQLFRAVRGQDVRQALFRWRHFPIYSTWGGLSNTAGNQLPAILFAALFNPAAAGVYMLTHRVLQMPITVLGQSVAQVFFSSAVDAKRDGQLAPLVATIHRNLANIAMPPALLMILIGPELFAFVFGSDWEQAGKFSQWMVPWLYLVFVSSPLSNLGAVMEKQAIAALFNIVQLMMRLSAILVGGYYGDLMTALMLYAIVNAFHVALYLAWIFSISGNRIVTIFYNLLRALTNGVIVCSPTILVVFLWPKDKLIIISLTLTVCLIVLYYAFLYKQESFSSKSNKSTLRGSD